MGTFTVKPLVIAINGGYADELVTTIPGWRADQPPNPYNATLAGLTTRLAAYGLGYIAYGDDGLANASITFGWGPDDPIFSLDEADPISFNSLPAGFAITSGYINMAGGSNYLGTVTTEFDGQSDITSGSLTSWSPFLSFEEMSAFDFIGKQLVISLSIDPNEGFHGIVSIFEIYSYGVQIAGEYSIPQPPSYRFVFDEVVVNSAPGFQDGYIYPVLNESEVYFTPTSAQVIQAISTRDMTPIQYLVSGAIDGDAYIRFRVGSVILNEDIDHPYGINDLPVGFIFKSLNIIIQGELGSHGEWVEFDNTGLNRVTIEADIWEPQNYPQSSLPSSLAILTNTYGFGSPMGLASSRVIYLFEVNGTYEIESDPVDDGENNYYNPDTNEYKYKSSNPGPPWVPLTVPLILIDGTVIKIPYKNPKTGDVIWTTQDPGPGWIPWIPSAPIIFKLPTYISPDIIVPTVLSDYVPIQFIPFKGASPVVFVPIPFRPYIPYIPVVFTPTIWINQGFPPDEEFDEGEYFVYSDPAIDTDNGYTVNVGGSAILVFIGSPSGIYTLVKGKTNDTLYSRSPFEDGETSVDVKIPNPFIVTGFLQ